MYVVSARPISKGGGRFWQYVKRRQQRYELETDLSAFAFWAGDGLCYGFCCPVEYRAFVLAGDLLNLRLFDSEVCAGKIFPAWAVSEHRQQYLDHGYPRGTVLHLHCKSSRVYEDVRQLAAYDGRPSATDDGGDRADNRGDIRNCFRAFRLDRELYSKETPRRMNGSSGFQ